MLYDKSHPDYMKTKLKKDVWRNVAQNMVTIDGKKIDGEKGKVFFNSGKTKLVNLLKAVKSGSGAESSSKMLEREKMMKIFSFLKDHLEPKSYVVVFVFWLRNSKSIYSSVTEDSFVEDEHDEVEALEETQLDNEEVEHLTPQTSNVKFSKHKPKPTQSVAEPRKFP